MRCGLSAAHSPPVRLPAAPLDGRLWKTGGFSAGFRFSESSRAGRPRPQPPPDFPSVFRPSCPCCFKKSALQAFLSAKRFSCFSMLKTIVGNCRNCLASLLLAWVVVPFVPFVARKRTENFFQSLENDRFAAEVPDWPKPGSLKRGGGGRRGRHAPAHPHLPQSPRPPSRGILPRPAERQSCPECPFDFAGGEE